VLRAPQKPEISLAIQQTAIATGYARNVSKTFVNGFSFHRKTETWTFRISILCVFAPWREHLLPSLPLNVHAISQEATAPSEVSLGAKRGNRCHHLGMPRRVRDWAIGIRSQYRHVYLRPRRHRRQEEALGRCPSLCLRFSAIRPAFRPKLQLGLWGELLPRK
jgi:hypothetical protein